MTIMRVIAILCFGAALLLALAVVLGAPLEPGILLVLALMAGGLLAREIPA